MSTNKHSRRLGCRVQGAGCRVQGAGSGGWDAGCLAGRTNGTLQRDFCFPCLHNPEPPQSCGFPPARAPGEAHRWQARCRGCSNEYQQTLKAPRVQSAGCRVQGAGSGGWGAGCLAGRTNCTLQRHFCLPCSQLRLGALAFFRLSCAMPPTPSWSAPFRLRVPPTTAGVLGDHDIETETRTLKQSYKILMPCPSTLCTICAPTR